VSLKRTNEVGLVQYGPRKRGGYKGFHGHFIEFGKTNRDGSMSTPEPFMEPSFNQTKGQIEGAIADSIGKKLNGYMKRTLKNG